MYCRNEELEAGWVVYSSGRLLHRPASFDAKPHQLCQVIDPYTLQVTHITCDADIHTSYLKVGPLCLHVYFYGFGLITYTL